MGYNNANKDCDKVLEDYHNMVNESNDLYAEAVAQQAQGIESVIEAIENLEKFKEFFKESYKVYDLANGLLKESNCSFNEDVNYCKCECLDRKSDKLYFEQFNEIYESIELLKKTLCKLQEAKYYGSEADKVFEKYNSCVHKKY